MAGNLQAILEELKHPLKQTAEFAQSIADRIYESMLEAPTRKLDQIFGTIAKAFDHAVTSGADKTATFIEGVYKKLQEKIFASKEKLHEVGKSIGNLLQAFFTGERVAAHGKFPKGTSEPSQLIMFSLNLQDLYHGFKEFAKDAGHGAQKTVDAFAHASKEMWQAVSSYLAGLCVSNPEKGAKYVEKLSYTAEIYPETLQDALSQETEGRAL